MLTYSLRPRGGVVHALEISEALARRGHEVELIALGPPGEGFFREPSVPVADRPLRDDRRARSTSGSWRCSPPTGTASPSRSPRAGST